MCLFDGLPLSDGRIRPRIVEFMPVRGMPIFTRQKDGAARWSLEVWRARLFLPERSDRLYKIYFCVESFCIFNLSSYKTQLQPEVSTPCSLLHFGEGFPLSIIQAAVSGVSPSIAGHFFGAVQPSNLFFLAPSIVFGMFLWFFPLLPSVPMKSMNSTGDPPFSRIQAEDGPSARRTCGCRRGFPGGGWAKRFLCVCVCVVFFFWGGWWVGGGKGKSCLF